MTIQDASWLVAGRSDISLSAQSSLTILRFAKAISPHLTISTLCARTLQTIERQWKECLHIISFVQDVPVQIARPLTMSQKPSSLESNEPSSPSPGEFGLVALQCFVMEYQNFRPTRQTYQSREKASTDRLYVRFT